VHPDTTVIVTTSPEIKHAGDRMGLSARNETAGAILAQGICFYQSYALEMAEANAADYLALGHWDRPMQVGNGAVPAYYSGSPALAGTVNLVHLTASGEVVVTRERLLRDPDPALP
jgi:hypothetical protein